MLTGVLRRKGIVFSVIMLRIATGVSSEEGETALVDDADQNDAVATGIQLSRVSSRGGRKSEPSVETA